VSRIAKNGDKEAIANKDLFEEIRAHINEGEPARSHPLSTDQVVAVRELHLLTMKPVLYIANVDEDGFESNPHLDAVDRIVSEEGSGIVVICNKLEAEIAELEETEKLDFLADLGMEEAGLDRVIRAGYKLLGLQTFFTAGPKEVRAWTVRLETTAPQAAGVIHTDFEKGFIRAEVISYDDYIEHQGENGAKDAGKWRLEGKDYLIHDGDVVHFRFNV
jgi:hypothetical protein